MTNIKEIYQRVLDYQLIEIKSRLDRIVKTKAPSEIVVMADCFAGNVNHLISLLGVAQRLEIDTSEIDRLITEYDNLLSLTNYLNLEGVK